MEKKHILSVCLLISLIFETRAQIFPNSDFELGINTACSCPTGYSCINDAGRVVDGVHPVFVAGNLGCENPGNTNYTNALGAHSGKGYVYFYAGKDKITTPDSSFLGGEQIKLCVWYAGPAQGVPGQNTPSSHFSFGVDGTQVSPNVRVREGKIWTQYCFTTTVSAGSHNFNILSGGAAGYSMWFDDFTVGDILTASVVSTNINCNENCNGTATIYPANGTPPYSYQWSNDQTTKTTTGLCVGTYTVIVSDDAGLKTTAKATISLETIPNIHISPDVSIISGDSTTLSISGGVSYQWSPQTGLSCVTCANPKASPESTTAYCVVVTDVNGCTESVCVTVVIEATCADIFIPNAFSPNNDASNNLLCVYGINCIQSLIFSIYSRWGEKVFETSDPKVCWDGIYKGKQMNTGVFTYRLSALLITGEKITKKGNINLIR